MARCATDQVLDVAVNVLFHARRSGCDPASQGAELHGVGLVTRAVAALVQLRGAREGGTGGGKREKDSFCSGFNSRLNQDMGLKKKNNTKSVLSRGSDKFPLDLDCAKPKSKTGH